MSLTLGLSLTAFRPGFGRGAPDPGATGLVATVSDFTRDRTLFDSGAALGLDAAVLARSGTTDAPDGTNIEMRVVRADTGAEVHPWAVVGQAGGGAWAGSYFGIGRSPHWLRPEVRAQGSTATATTANRFGVGHVWAIWQQSEHHRMISSSYSRTTVEAPLAEDAVQFVTHGRETPNDVDTFSVQPNIASFNAATRAAGTITASMAAMANVLMAERPGEKFCIVFQTLSGTSFLNAASDDNQERIFANDKAIHDLATADGQTVGLGFSSWYARPRGLKADYGAALMAFSHGKTYDGTDFVDGDGLVNGGAGNYSLSLGGNTYDIDHTARELYGTTPPWVASGPHRFETDGDQSNAVRDAGGALDTGLVNIEACRLSTRALVAAHPTLFRKGIEITSYINGYDRELAGETAFPDWGDLSHPNANDDDGLPRFARMTAHAMLHGAGLSDYEEPVLNREYWEPAGAFAEFWFEDTAGNTPDMTTTRIKRGAVLQTDLDLNGQPMAHVTDVFGWEINRRPAERVEIVTGTTVSSKVIRVYPKASQIAFNGTDLIEFGRGGATGKVRDPEDFYGEYWQNMPLADVAVAGAEGIPVSALPTLTNPLALPASVLDFVATALVKSPGNAYVSWRDDNNTVLSTSGPVAGATNIVLSRNDNLSVKIAWDISGLFSNGDFGSLVVEIEVNGGSGAPITRPFTVVTKVGTNDSLSAGVNYTETLEIPEAGIYSVRLDFVAGSTPWIGFDIPAAAGGDGAVRVIKFRSIVMVNG